MAYYRDDKLLKKFGFHVKELRLKKKMTQEDLAFESELDLTQIGRIERGVTNPSLFVMQRLSKALKIKLKDMLDF